MKNVIFILTVVCSTVLFSCGNSEKKKIENLKKEVMAVHDSIMPQMGTIIELKSKLKEKLEDTSVVSEKTRDSLKAAVKRLEKADKAMKDWMHNYNPPKLDSMELKNAENYLKEQKDEIIEVRKKFKSSIKRAKELLNEKNKDRES